MESWIKAWLLLLFLLVCPGVYPSETKVCLYNSSCILPCRDRYGTTTTIHWDYMTGGDVTVHSFYSNRDQLQLQDPRFQGRTSLVEDPIGGTKTALMLKDIKVQDEGKYSCFLSSGYHGDQLCYVVLQVDAPVQRVDLVRAGNSATCRSEGVYPQPELTWSTQPPSDHLQKQSSVEFHRSAAGLVSVHSSLSLPHGDRSVSCSVQTRSNQRKTTLMPPASVQVRRSAARLSCSPPAAPPVSVTWSFNHRHVLIWSSDPGLSRVSEKWKEHVKESQSLFELTLKDISRQHEGRYVCEVESSEERLITEIDVETERSGSYWMIMTAVFPVPLVAVALAAVLLLKNMLPEVWEHVQRCWRRPKQSPGCDGETGGLQLVPVVISDREDQLQPVEAPP